jgi:DNA ligase D-like protein (predicted polymerase)
MAEKDAARAKNVSRFALNSSSLRGSGKVYPIRVAKSTAARDPSPGRGRAPDNAQTLEIDGHSVRISNPGKLYFSREAQLSKLDIVRYFLAVSAGALGGIADRPIVLKRFVDGACLAESQPEPFYQKRAPADLPAFLRTVTLSFPSGRTAEEIVVDNPAALAWIVNLGCIELHPHPVRSGDLDHPDQLRIDLDPQPGIEFSQVRRVALEVKSVLEENGLTGAPKTSGSRGIHINVPIQPRWSFTEVRRAALALARAVERRAPSLATSKWWKEERHGVFLDYNQNAKDRTTASAYSVRPLPDARVSAPLFWAEVADCNPADFTVITMPGRLASVGDPNRDLAAGSLEALLDLAARDEAEGLGDAPWPPHFAKAEGEPKRVQPSKAKSFSDQIGEGFGDKRFRRRASGTVAPASVLPAGEAASSASGSSAAAEKPARKTSAKRAPKFPLLIIAHSPDKQAALDGLSRWKQAHPQAATLLAEDDILIDRMRGSAYVWYRVRVNLRNVPEAERPAQATPDPDDDPTREWKVERQ